MNDKIQVTARELAKIMGISYLLASNFVRILEAKGMATRVDSRPPEGRGRSTNVFEIDSVISFSLEEALV